MEEVQHCYLCPEYFQSFWTVGSSDSLFPLTLVFAFYCFPDTVPLQTPLTIHFFRPLTSPLGFLHQLPLAFSFSALQIYLLTNAEHVNQ